MGTECIFRPGPLYQLAHPFPAHTKCSSLQRVNSKDFITGKNRNQFSSKVTWLFIHPLETCRAAPIYLRQQCPQNPEGLWVLRWSETCFKYSFSLLLIPWAIFLDPEDLTMAWICLWCLVPVSEVHGGKRTCRGWWVVCFGYDSLPVGFQPPPQVLPC